MPFYTKHLLLEILDNLGINLSKKRGQCYLIDQNIISLILKTAELNPSTDIILEIGSGLGTLSDLLIENSKRVYLYEIDKKIVNFLFKNLKSRGVSIELKIFSPVKENLQLQEETKITSFFESKEQNILLHGDFLKSPMPVVNKIISNIPYQISAPIIFKIINNWSYSKVILMVQKEFANRLLGRVNTKEYSRISAATGLYIDVIKIREVPSSCFYPQPKVSSMIIELVGKSTLEENALEFIHKDLYLNFLRDIFPYKNKNLEKAIAIMLKNNQDAINLFPFFNKNQHPVEDIPEIDLIFKRKVRSLSPQELFSIMMYGKTGKQK
jgi:16S rRNA (adenine1518-N6/adenine1519-N6)-dimethyltransferase